MAQENNENNKQVSEIIFSQSEKIQEFKDSKSYFYVMIEKENESMFSDSEICTYIIDKSTNNVVKEINEYVYPSENGDIYACVKFTKLKIGNVSSKAIRCYNIDPRNDDDDEEFCIYNSECIFSSQNIIHIFFDDKYVVKFDIDKHEYWVENNNATSITRDNKYVIKKNNYLYIDDYKIVNADSSFSFLSSNRFITHKNDSKDVHVCIQGDVKKFPCDETSLVWVHPEYRVFSTFTKENLTIFNFDNGNTVAVFNVSNPKITTDGNTLYHYSQNVLS
jgi:hypothetical protein